MIDEEGVELADLEADEACGLKNARELAAEQMRSGHLNLAHYIEILDELGELLATVLFGQAVEIKSA